MIIAAASEACPIEALRSDHRRAMRLVGLLLERIDRLRRLEQEDVRLTHDIFRYMVGFVDERHHAREDRVIDALVARAPHLGSQVGRITEAHDELRREGEILLGQLAAMRERVRVRGKRKVVPRLAKYAAALAAHFESEEQELFGTARAVLTPEDWHGIEDQGADPLFGPQVERGFEALFEVYTGRVWEIGTPPRVLGPRAAAVMVDSTAALLGGARDAASAIVSGSKQTIYANLAGVSAVAQSRNLLDLAAATSAWTTGAVGEARAAVRKVRDVTRDAAHSTLDPVNCALGTPRQFVASQRIDQTPPSWQAHLVNLGLRALVKRAANSTTIEAVRQPRSRIERMLTALDNDVRVTSVPIGGGEMEIFEIAGIEPERTIIHFPGGGFIMQPMQAHRLLAARLARQARARVALVHYRLAPENLYPAGFDDCLAGYRYLLDIGTDPQSIVVMGDSAGGCFALSSLLRMRVEGLPLPAAAVAISPVTDLSYSGHSRHENRWADPSLPNDERNLLAEIYLGGADREDPLVSPLFGDLAGLPPTLLQVGSVEVLLDDSLRFAAKMRGQGGECECEVWHEMPHDFLLFGILPEAKKALARVVKFIERHAPTPEWMVSAPAPLGRRRTEHPRWWRSSPAVAGRQAA